MSGDEVVEGFASSAERLKGGGRLDDVEGEDAGRGGGGEGEVVEFYWKGERGNESWEVVEGSCARKGVIRRKKHGK